MPARTIGSIDPGQVDAAAVERAARRIGDYLESHPDEDLLQALGEVGEADALILPRPIVVLFAQILGTLAQGKGVQIMPKDMELTTQQAADLLNVSRPYLIGLLEAGKIGYRKVGKHRRVTFEAIMEYRRRDDAERRAAADELAGLTEELGLY
jgi:excisionase family DNA binding protein